MVATQASTLDAGGERGSIGSPAPLRPPQSEEQALVVVVELAPTAVLSFRNFANLFWHDPRFPP